MSRLHTVSEDEDIYLLESFKADVDLGCFNEDDGIGYLAMIVEGETREDWDLPVFANLRNPPKGYTHVVWYNK